ncbi:MAG: RtcB family protein [Acholeplasmataceae bacterium]|jgi:RNA-splicing ligase RtcB
MIKVKGKFNEATIFTDDVDAVTLEQVERLVNQEFTQDSKIKIMPDCHAGVGCVIGTTMTITDKIVPNLVGVDIGCGLIVIELGKIDINLIKLDDFITANIPSGFDVNDKVLDDSIDLSKMKCYDNLKNKNYLMRSIGSLGSGNHFIEIDIDNEGNKYLIIHSGSRNLGTQVAEYYQKEAVRYHRNKILNIDQERMRIIEEYHKTGRKKEIDKALKKLSKTKIDIGMPDDLAYLEGNLFDDYIHDMVITQKFASLNRQTMAKTILKYLDLDYDFLPKFETIHNYINTKDMILRKGAISAYEGERLIIPINMKDGCIIGVGKSYEPYNFSAPHGAGRLMSRTEAFKQISLKEFKDSMKEIYSTSVTKETIDEAPFVYKPIEMIIDNISETVEIEKIIVPIYNFKAK